MNELRKNQVLLQGEVVSDFELLNEIQSEKFYTFKFAIKRDSGIVDTINVNISERKLTVASLSKYLTIQGELRTKNYEENGKNRLSLYVFAKEVFVNETHENSNEVELLGFICKEPIYRLTPSKREICDMMVAVNRLNHRSDYIPCITWGRNAQYTSELLVGTMVNVKGRIQSREYEKEGVTRIAYELSVNEVSVG